MNRYLFLLLLLLANKVYAQSEPKTEKRHYGYGYNTIYDTELFDTAEIRKRQFKTAYLIYHPCNWATGKSTLNDTLLIYHFDTSGFVRENSYIDTTGDRTTWFLDNRGSVTRSFRISKLGDTLQGDKIKINTDNTVKFRESYSRIKEGFDSIYTTLILEQEGSSFDTLYFIKTIKDENGKVKEYLSVTSQRSARRNHILFPTVHYKYEYDDEGRLIAKKDLVFSKTYKTSYFDETNSRTYRPTQGEIYETWNVSNNRMLNAEIKFMDEDGVITSTTKQKHVIISPLEKGSKLVKLLTVIVTEELPVMEYYEVTYK